MPKRKRKSLDGASSASAATTTTPPAGTTFSLLDGKIDILQGLAMHKDAITPQFEQELISFVQTQCTRGRSGELKKPTYLRTNGARSQGNSREMIMYGGFFDFNRARPGKRGLVPPFPPILERLVDQLLSNNYLPRDVRPDSCIINQYNAGDCIPPHVDHASYYRPISTLSLLGEEPMLVGSKFRTVKSSTWEVTKGKSILLPRRSLLVLGGNSGNIAKHCISSCRGKRISITLRKQPPPDWRPDASELVAGNGNNAGIGGNVRGGTKSTANQVTVKNATNMGGEQEGQQQKRKPLSGSAKRRKKMVNRSGIRDSIEGGTADYANKQKQQSAKPQKGSGVNNTEGAPKKKQGERNVAADSSEKNKKQAEKQARRNARRLAKKKEDAASIRPQDES